MRAVSFCLVVFGILLSGCKSDPSSSSPVAPPALVKAVYVLNEGDFSDPTGARLSLYDVDGDTVYTDVIEAANGGQHLGNTGDDMALYNGKAYIIMSGSENLVVVSLNDHGVLQSSSFPGDSPNDILIDSLRNKIYVTRLYKSSLLVLDLATLIIIDSIAVGNNPQGLLLNGNNLFVCNTGYGSSKTVSVIDVRGDTIKTTLTLADGPTQAAISSEGKLWIACTGNAFGSPSTAGKVFIVNPLSLVVEDSIAFAENLWGGNLAMGINGYAYVIAVNPASFYGGPVYRISTATKVVTTNFIATDTYYAISIDPVSGDLYLADAKNFSSNGVVTIFNKDGQSQRSFAAQKGPAAMAFKR